MLSLSNIALAIAIYLKRYYPFVILFTSYFSCRTQPNSDRHYADGDPSKVYNLRLDLPPGSKYDYEISKESEFKLEVNEKKIDNLNKVDADRGRSG